MLAIDRVNFGASSTERGRVVSAQKTLEVSALNKRKWGPDRSARGDRELIKRIDAALDVMHGRWKVYLLFLMARGIHRHSRLLDGLPGASKKVMTDTLRALERDGLVTRQAFAEVPLRVEYSLTPLGWSMTEPLMALSEWGSAHAAEIDRARYQYRLGAAHSPAAA
jgi:DNA-binding HxlR family transcriptional regulator